MAEANSAEKIARCSPVAWPYATKANVATTLIDSSMTTSKFRLTRVAAMVASRRPAVNEAQNVLSSMVPSAGESFSGPVTLRENINLPYARSIPTGSINMKKANTRTAKPSRASPPNHDEGLTVSFIDNWAALVAVLWRMGERQKINTNMVATHRVKVDIMEYGYSMAAAAIS